MIVQVIDRQSECVIDMPAMTDIATKMLRHLNVRSAELSVVFVDDPTIAGLNRRFLDHEGPTDIITFPISEPDAACLEGELVISAPWAARVAAENGDDLHHELALYIAHGILHLLGLDDRSPEDAAKMKRREMSLLTTLGLPIPRGRFEESPDLPETSR